MELNINECQIIALYSKTSHSYNVHSTLWTIVNIAKPEIINSLAISKKYLPSSHTRKV